VFSAERDWLPGPGFSQTQPSVFPHTTSSREREREKKEKRGERERESENQIKSKL
jgi:hypothetical protein